MRGFSFEPVLLMPMHQFAIIGCGHIAVKHAENILEVGALKAVCDIVPERADDFAARYKAKAYYTIEDLLANEPGIDIISICTPNGMHAEHSIKTLQAGKHILCEKPLCLTTAGAWQVIETEKYCRKKLFVVKATRYNPLLADLKKLITENKLGRLYSFHLSCLWNRSENYYSDWKGKLFPAGGTLYTQFSHYIDTLIWLFGELEEAKGFGTNAAHQNSIEFEDTGTAALKMLNGVLGTLHWSVNSYKKNREIALTLIAEKGTISIGGEYLDELLYQQMQEDFTFHTYEKDKSQLSNHKEVYEQLIKALDENDNTMPDVFDGMKTVTAIEKIYKAINPS
jgi:UDP-N-acetyl-2-amino-2-deoxyglucuronate dehydrogenase